MQILINFKGIRSICIRMQIGKGFEAFECKFETFKRDSKNSNANSNHLKRIWSIWMQIWTIRIGFEALECKFETFESDSKHSNRSMQIGMIGKGFKASESKFECLQMDPKHSNANSNHFKGIRSIRTICANSNHLKGILAFKCKF